MVKQSSFHPKIELLVRQILSSKRQAVPTANSSNTRIHLTRETCIQYPHVVTYLENTYGKEQFTYYSLCSVKGVQFKVHLVKSTQVDDSAVVYTDGFDDLHIGMIVGIIKLKHNDEILFIIDEAKINGYDFFLLNGTKYINNFFVFVTLKTPRNIVSIHYDSIQEKVAYRLDNCTDSICEFHLFPNRLEST